MTASAPIERTRSSFDVLATPVTSAPNAFAICTAIVPTPPAAPMTRTFCPGCTFALSRMAWRAVTPETGTAAACSKEAFAGLRTSLWAGVTACSAKDPASATPITSSPGRNVLTAEPVLSTVPATSQPRIGTLGRRSPSASRAMYGWPVMMCHTSGPAPAACTRTSTSLSSTTGSSTSRNSRTSGGPYVSCAIAFMGSPLPPTPRVYAVHLLAYSRVYVVHLSSPGLARGSNEESVDGHGDRGDRTTARGPDQGADPAGGRRPRRRGRGRVAQHAEDRPGTRCRPDGALQARGEQGR